MTVGYLFSVVSQNSIKTGKCIKIKLGILCAARHRGGRKRRIERNFAESNERAKIVANDSRSNMLNEEGETWQMLIYWQTREIIVYINLMIFTSTSRCSYTFLAF